MSFLPHLPRLRLIHYLWNRVDCITESLLLTLDCITVSFLPSPLIDKFPLNCIRVLILALFHVSMSHKDGIDDNAIILLLLFLETFLKTKSLVSGCFFVCFLPPHTHTHPIHVYSNSVVLFWRVIGGIHTVFVYGF